MIASANAALVASLLFPLGMIYAGLRDLTTMRIPNALIAVLLVGFLLLAPLAGWGMPEIGLSIAVAVAVLLCTFALFAFGVIGGGDAKLAAVTALWFGADHTLTYLAYMAIFGGLLTLVLLQFRTLPLPDFMMSRPWIARLHAPQSGVPYGVAMAVAALIVFPATDWMSVIL